MESFGSYIKGNNTDVQEKFRRMFLAALPITKVINKIGSIYTKV